jgi:hypothetical protein
MRPSANHQEIIDVLDDVPSSVAELFKSYEGGPCSNSGARKRRRWFWRTLMKMADAGEVERECRSDGVYLFSLSDESQL